MIVITRATEKILNLVNELLEKNITDIHVLINSDVLEKKSKLRNFFEKEKSVVCIPFYDDDTKTLSLMANNFIREKNISI